MSHTLDLLAFDIGASGGRAILFRFDGEALSLTEVHRFPNDPVASPDGLHWDVRGLFAEIERGLALTCEQHGPPRSVGIDAWGVDFALLGDDGQLLFDPFHYRDRRTDGMMAQAFKRVPRRDIFAQTGIQFLPFNTLYQLLSMAVANPRLLHRASTFLTIPDLFDYWLTGRAACEFTNATTTQFYDVRTRGWATSLLERLGIPTHLLPEVVMPGTVLGTLLPPLAAETGAGSVQVIAPASHDTASAVAAVPAGGGDDFAYISSGTWSLVGIEVREPVISDASMAANLTNEGGADNRVHLLRNVAGLWLLQECRRAWTSGGAAPSYDELASLAEKAPAFVTLVDPDDPSFLSPPDMPTAIIDFCRRTGQPSPAARADTVRCILESLALKYRWVLEQIASVSGHRVSVIHVIGGGSRNHALCQFTADAIGLPVIAGPAEATAVGNAIVQAMALGQVRSLDEGRALVRHSFDPTAYVPRDCDRWDEAYDRFLTLLALADGA